MWIQIISIYHYHINRDIEKNEKPKKAHHTIIKIPPKHQNKHHQSISFFALILSMFPLEEWIGTTLFKISVGLSILHNAQHWDMCCWENTKRWYCTSLIPSRLHLLARFPIHWYKSTLQHFYFFFYIIANILIGWRKKIKWERVWYFIIH